MTIFLFENNAQGTLAGSISNTAVTVLSQAGQGALFPNPGGGQQFGLTFTDTATGLIREIVYCTARTGDTFTIVRAQEGTTALNWSANDLMANLWTAGQAAAMLQVGQVQAQGENFAVDSGATNAIVANYTPTIVAPVAGMPLRVQVANTNTGPTTFNPGPGAAAVVTATGSALAGREFQAGSTYELMWNQNLGKYELMSPTQSGVYAGSVVQYAGGTIPPGWLACYGQSLLRTDYPDLFTAIGTAYGAVDGTHFNLPDLRGRVVAGLDNMGGTPANRLTSTTMSPDGNTIGAVGGAQTGVTSTSVALAGHVTGTLQIFNPATGSGTANIASAGAAVAAGAGTNVSTTGDGVTVTINVTSGINTLTFVQDNGPTFNSASFNIVQPTMLMNQIIKAYN